MPLIKVIRKGIAPHVRKVPTCTTAIVLPMTLDRVGKDAASQNEEPTLIEDLREAFDRFQPAIQFRGCAGSMKTTFRADLQFRSIKDFDPENLQKKQEIRNENNETEYLRNDIADLKSRIDLLYRLKNSWMLPTVRRAWNDEQQRKEILQAFERLRVELTKVAAKGSTV